MVSLKKYQALHEIIDTFNCAVLTWWRMESCYSRYIQVPHSEYKWNVDVFIDKSHISEYGDGWGPAVLETEVEHSFIQESQKGLTDDYDYFIGGSAYPQIIGPFVYPAPFGFKLKGSPEPAYSPSQSGNMASESKDSSLIRLN